MHARCIAHIPPDGIELREIEVREPGAGEVLVESAYSCISPGTELRYLRTMPAGEAYIPGYALAGRVVRRGPRVAGLEGARVLVQGTRDTGGLGRMYGGHSSHAVVSASELIPVPDGVDLLDASVCRIAGISCHGLKLSRPQPGETVAVVGLGLIGQLSARLHQLSGARVVAADRSARRVEIARAAGVEAFQVEGSLSETFRPHLPEGADIVVDATGASPVIRQAVALGRDLPWDNAPGLGPRYLVQGSYQGDLTIPFREIFMKEMSFLFPRDRQRRDDEKALELVAQGQLVVRDVVEARRPEDATEIYDSLRDLNSPLLTAAFRWLH